MLLCLKAGTICFCSVIMFVMCQKAFFKKICGGCTPGVDPTNEEQSGVIVSQGKNGQDLGLDSNPVEYGKVMGMSLL